MSDPTIDMTDMFPPKKRPHPKTMTWQERSLYSKMVKAFERLDLCSGCLEEIDIECCHCGEDAKAHTYEHSFTPAGCMCHVVFKVFKESIVDD